MSGLVATVLVPRPLGVEDSGRVTSILKNLFDEVQDTRKGRHWEFSVENHAASLSVVSTSKKVDEYEVLFVALGSSPEQLPEAFEILFGCSTEIDQIACKRLRQALVDEFDGVDSER